MITASIAFRRTFDPERELSGERIFGSVILKVSVLITEIVSCLTVIFSFHLTSLWTILTVSFFSWTNTISESLSISVSPRSVAVVLASCFPLVSCTVLQATNNRQKPMVSESLKYIFI